MEEVKGNEKSPYRTFKGKNRVLPLSHEQFKSLTAEFIKVSAKTWGIAESDISVKVSAYSKVKGEWNIFGSKVFGEIDDGRGSNVAGKGNVIVEKASMDTITAEVFKQAASVKIDIFPKDSENRNGAFGVIKDGSKRKWSLFLNRAKI